MSNISLTASMRTNLLSLQNTQSLMDTTQERLSTGKKVNSAIDNPSSYYTAQNLTNRASDLETLLDSMGQGIQTIKAANEGIEAITSFVQQAKAVANTARDTAAKSEIESSGTYVAEDGKMTIKVGDETLEVNVTQAGQGDIGKLVTAIQGATDYAKKALLLKLTMTVPAWSLKPKTVPRSTEQSVSKTVWACLLMVKSIPFPVRLQ